MKVIGDCPACGAKESFGNVEIMDGKNVYRGCKSCRYHVNFPLPPLQKKILYLDQFFFSHAFRGNDSRFKAAADKIARVAALQLVVVPYSSIHEDETHQWERRDELFKFVKATARGHKFSYAPQLEQAQIVKAFSAALKNAPLEYSLERRDALREDVNKWDGYMRIEVGKYRGDIELIRRLKTQTIGNLISAFPTWRTDNSSFGEDLILEYEAGAQEFISAYLIFASRISRGDMSAIIDSPVASDVIKTMLQVLPRDEDYLSRLNKCSEFFVSPHFRATPAMDLSCKIFATLKRMVKEGQFTNEERTRQVLSGFLYDVSHVATYAPYCDAFLMDKTMAEIVARPTVNLEATYGTKVFSLTNWQAFLGWLDALESEMSAEHRAALVEAYDPPRRNTSFIPG